MGPIYANGSSHAVNKQAQLASAYQELGKELASEKLKVVGGYTIGRIIGEGSFGAVHIATHRLTGVRCAIKKIPKTLSSQVTREIHHHRRLHHLHIVQLYEIIATESHIWLVTELCSGGELFDYLVERGRMLEGETRRLFGELTVAVGHMHNQGIVHRDLKLENILLDGELKVKLADLGFAREWQRGKLMETYCGTTGYASPEMLSGKKYLGVETDVWSLGIILYILLCGGLPFDHDDERVMKDMILKGEYEEPDWLSQEARSLIKLLLNQTPSERPSIEAIFAHPWFHMTIVDTLPGNHSMPASPHPTQFAEPWTKVDSLQLPPSVAASPLSTPSIQPGPSSLPDSDPSHYDFHESGQSSGLTTPIEEDEIKRVHSGEFSHNEKAMELLHSNISQSTIRASPHSIVKKSLALSTPLEGLDEEPHRTISFDDHTLHLPVAQSSRTPSRTKRRSVSSTLSLERRLSHHSTTGQYQTYSPEDYLAMLRTQRSPLFSTPSEKFLLNQLNDLGFDVGQLTHSVETDACDSSSSAWWLLRAKQVERGETDEIITARHASNARKREKLATYAREERRKARENAPTITPAVAFADDTYHLAPPMISTPSDITVKRAESPTTHIPTTPTRETRPVDLSSPDNPREKAGKTRSPSMSMLQRATSALMGTKDEPRERSMSEDPNSRSTSPTKLIKPQRTLTKSESDSTLLTVPNPSPVTLRSEPFGPQAEAGPSQLSKAPKRDSMWSSWTQFRQFFDQGGQRKKRRDDGTPLRPEGKPTIVLSRGIAARNPHVNRINQSASRRASLDGRPQMYSRRSSSVNSRRSSVTSMHLPSDFMARINSHDNLPSVGRKASLRSHGSQTPTSDREEYRTERRNSLSSRGFAREMRSPSMQSDSSGRMRAPASPLHNYQRRPPQGTASKRIRHIRVIPETQVIRSGASSIKSQSSRASSVDGRRDDSDYDTGREDSSSRSRPRDHADLGRQIHRKSSPLAHGQSKRSTLKPKAALRDVFQGKDDEWEDEDEFAGGYGQCRGGTSTGDRWVNGARAASFPNAVVEKKKHKRRGSTEESEVAVASMGRRGIASRGAPMPIAEEEEEEEE